MSSPDPSPAAERHCFHCGLEIPAGADFAVDIETVRQAMCCAGCAAVAQAIVAGGMAAYYRQRSALPESPRDALPADLQALGLFDLPAMQTNFARDVGENEREAALIIEGITCAACVWLNEMQIGRVPGVTAVAINYATRRARVRWDVHRAKLSDILAAVAAVGYRAHPFDAAKSEQLAAQERRRALWRLFVAGFGMMQVMMYAVPVYLAGEGEMSADIEQLMRWASLLLTLPVILYSALPFFTAALRDLRLRRLGMDVPVALGVGSAFVASCWATLTGQGEVYFDSVTMFVFFLLTGRYLELMARQKAVRGVEAVSLAMPAFAERLSDWPETATTHGERVAVAQLVAGDIVRIKPGETVPADGTVLAGSSTLDESLLTGESRPVERGKGAPLVGGCVNRGSPLVMQVTHVGEGTRLAAIVRLMERAAAEKPRLVVLADRIAARFVLLLLLLAGATGVWWSMHAPQEALRIFVAVLVVSCPCALSLATPAALTVATGGLAQIGVLVTRGHAIETLARATHFVFDKTGTLTLGQPQLLALWQPAGLAAGLATSQSALALAAALEAGSEHPLAEGIRRAWQAAGANPIAGVDELVAHTGYGISGHWTQPDGKTVAVRLGKPDFACPGQALPAALADWQDDTVLALSLDGSLAAALRFADAPRPQAANAVAALRALGAQVSILSGDAPATVRRLAQTLAITEAEGGLSPEDKHARLRRLQAGGAIVAMVGDGVNDAPVLAQAQVSVAMAGGADLAKSHADIVLLHDDLSRFAQAVRLARQSMRVIRQNLLWAAAYNLSAIPLAMVGWVTPWLAGIGMSASSLFVVANALRLQRPAPERIR